MSKNKYGKGKYEGKAKYDDESSEDEYDKYDPSEFKFNAGADNLVSDDDTDTEDEVESEDEKKDESDDEANNDEEPEEKIEEILDEFIEVEPEEEPQKIIPKQYYKKIIRIPEDERRSSDRMSFYEQTEYTSIRGKQIAMFGGCFVPIEGLSDPVAMARKELMMRKAPLKLRRRIGEIYNEKTNVLEVYVEDWDVNGMEFTKYWKV